MENTYKNLNFRELMQALFELTKDVEKINYNELDMLKQEIELRNHFR